MPRKRTILPKRTFSKSEFWRIFFPSPFITEEDPLLATETGAAFLSPGVALFKSFPQTSIEVLVNDSDDFEEESEVASTVFLISL